MSLRDAIAYAETLPGNPIVTFDPAVFLTPQTIHLNGTALSVQQGNVTIAGPGADRLTIDAILDEGLVCHLGFVSDGQPVVIPTMYVRDGDRVVVHGSAASRMTRTALGFKPCVAMPAEYGSVTPSAVPIG